MGNSVADFKDGLIGPRDRFQTHVSGSDISTVYPTGATPSSVVYAAGSASRCVDHNTPLYYKLERLRSKNPGLRNVDFGHPFAKESVSMSMPSVHHDLRQRNTSTSEVFFKGVFPPSVDYKTKMRDLAVGRFPAIPTALGTDKLALWALGSTAIARSLPDVPEFSLFRFVGELREGLPKVPLAVLARERKLRNVGGEYLNVQFGIMPLISDLQKFLEAVVHPELRAAVKRQLYEEHRVRKTIDKGTTTTTRALTSSETPSLSLLNASGIKGTLTTTSSYEIWSSCSFAYHQVNMLDRLLDDINVMTGQLGVIPTAIDLWNLMPWSWLVDWFTNFNHVITNLSYLGRDGLYLQRGYIMGHYKDEEITHQDRVQCGTPITSTGVRLFERKYRVHASPFGFGLTWKDFSPFQQAILGALGVSRLRF